MSFSNFQFSKPLLTKSRFEMNGVSGEQNKEISINLKRNILKLDGQNKALVELTVEMNQKEGAVIEGTFFFGEFTMQSLFTWDSSLPDSQVDSFLNYNAPALLISYIRPHVSLVSSMSPAGQCDIPYINVLELFKPASEK